MIKHIVLMLLLFVTNTAWAIPDKYKDLRWHFLQTTDFEVVSLEPNTPAVIQNYLVDVKAWTTRRWGIPDLPFIRPCMVICFPNYEVFKELTKRDAAETRLMKTQGLDGKERWVYAIWVYADPEGQWLKTSLPEGIARAVMLNYQDSYRANLPAWMHLGMSYLNNDISTLKEALKQTGSTDRAIFTMTLDEFYKKPPAERLAIKRKCAAGCLMIRKELGGTKFSEFFSKISGGNLSAAVTHLGYKNIEEFVDKQNVYCRNLSYDLNAGKTPNLYLTWYVR